MDSGTERERQRACAATTEGESRLRLVLRRSAVNLFIVYALGIQLSHNFGPIFRSASVGAAEPAPVQSTGGGGTELLARFSRAARYGEWVAEYAGWLAGLSSIWRMFAPPHHQRWGYEVYAELSDGSLARLPLPDDGTRTFWQRNFTDFRETKWRLNIYNSDEGRALFAASACYGLQAHRASEEREPRAIRIVLRTQPIHSPPVAARLGTALGEESRREVARVECGG